MENVKYFLESIHEEIEIPKEVYDELEKKFPVIENHSSDLIANMPSNEIGFEHLSKLTIKGLTDYILIVDYEKKTNSDESDIKKVVKDITIVAQALKELDGNFDKIDEYFSIDYLLNRLLELQGCYCCNPIIPKVLDTNIEDTDNMFSYFKKVFKKISQ